MTFNCGGVATITIASTKTIDFDTTIDGGGLITISAGNPVGIFAVRANTFEVRNLTIANGMSNTVIGGGGISNESGTVTVTNTTFFGNNALGQGGGISNVYGGRLSVTNSTFSASNTSGRGGGIYNKVGTVTVSNTTFSGNNASEGGAGIYNDDGTLTVTNSTFSGNAGRWGGAIMGLRGAVTVTNSTFAGNSAISGAGIAMDAGALTVTNTIVAQSISGGNCYSDWRSSITDGGHNLDSGTSCGFSTANGSLNSTDPKLEPAGLANNGGPTQTIALQASSPAIDAGNPAVCAAPPVNAIDQRGYVRPGTGKVNCSIGAYEFNAPGLPSCCQCPASCADPIGGSCGNCMAIFGATCKGGSLCVLNTATPTPTATRLTPTPTPTPTVTPTPAVTDCCQCAGFCAPPINGTCGGCTVVFQASCTGGLLCTAYTATPTVKPASTSTPTGTTTRTPTATPTVTPTPQPCVGDCKSIRQVTVDDVLTMVNIALGNADVSACQAGDANGDKHITVDEILMAVRSALAGCPE